MPNLAVEMFINFFFLSQFHLLFVSIPNSVPHLIDSILFWLFVAPHSPRWNFRPRVEWQRCRADARRSLDTPGSPKRGPPRSLPAGLSFCERERGVCYVDGLALAFLGSIRGKNSAFPSGTPASFPFRFPRQLLNNREADITPKFNLKRSVYNTSRI